MTEKITQNAGRKQLGDFAPDFAHFNDDILFGENWNLSGIDLKTRCLLTVVTLMAQGITDSSLSYHLENAKNHGVSKAEIVATITHVAFYAGWPKAWAVFNLAKNIWTEDSVSKDAKAAYQKTMIFPIGDENTAYARYFTGTSYLASITEGQLPVHNVTFEPGCRNYWHIHHATNGGGQLLICVGGRGFYQEEGKAAVVMNPGDSIIILAGVKHWHGAAQDSWFSHLAIALPGENTRNEWLAAVSDEEYKKANESAN